MEVEHDVKVFRLDGDLEQNIQAMNRDGWLMLPGVAPVAIYHVVRMKGIAPVSDDGDGHKPIARIAIDDTKVHLYRDGKPVEGH